VDSCSFEKKKVFTKSRPHVAVALGQGGGAFVESRLEQEQVGSLLTWQVGLGTGGKKMGTSSHKPGRSGRRVCPISEETGRSRRRFAMLCVQACVTVPFWSRVALAFPSTRYPETVGCMPRLPQKWPPIDAIGTIHAKRIGVGTWASRISSWHWQRRN
jgi:hypothetical protein